MFILYLCRRRFKRLFIKSEDEEEVKGEETNTDSVEMLLEILDVVGDGGGATPASAADDDDDE